MENFIFRAMKNKKKTSQRVILELVEATGNVMAADVSAVNAELESFSQKKGRKGSSYNASIPSRVKEDVGKYSYSNGTLAPINRFKSKCTQYTFLRTSIDNWKRKFNNQEEDVIPPIFNKCRRPNLVKDDLLQKKWLLE